MWKNKVIPILDIDNKDLKIRCDFTIEIMEKVKNIEPIKILKLIYNELLDMFSINVDSSQYPIMLFKEYDTTWKLVHNIMQFIWFGIYTNTLKKMNKIDNNELYAYLIITNYIISIEMTDNQFQNIGLELGLNIKDIADIICNFLDKNKISYEDTYLETLYRKMKSTLEQNDRPNKYRTIPPMSVENKLNN